MTTHSSPGRAGIATLTVLSLLIWDMAPLLSAQTAPAPAAQTAPAPEAGEEAVDLGWPRTYATQKGGSVVIYQPQVASWDRQRHVVAYSAVTYSTAGAEKPAIGSI
ncbi:MAG: hypothetical protein ACRD1X_12910, partial [Vicinamibacteria bacterium]